MDETLIFPLLFSILRSRGWLDGVFLKLVMLFSTLKMWLKFLNYILGEMILLKWNSFLNMIMLLWWIVWIRHLIGHHGDFMRFSSIQLYFLHICVRCLSLMFCTKLIIGLMVSQNKVRLEVVTLLSQLMHSFLAQIIFGLLIL